jgi:hypothetical protein
VHQRLPPLIVHARHEHHLDGAAAGLPLADEPGEGDEEVFQMAMSAAWDFMSANGVPDSDLEIIFNSEDAAECNAAALRAQEFIGESLPGDDDGMAAQVDGFAFGGEQESVFDAVYKKKFAIRKGRKVVIRKRISGVVVMSWSAIPSAAVGSTARCQSASCNTTICCKSRTGSSE